MLLQLLSLQLYLFTLLVVSIEVFWDAPVRFILFDRLRFSLNFLELSDFTVVLLNEVFGLIKIFSLQICLAAEFNTDSDLCLIGC